MKAKKVTQPTSTHGASMNRNRKRRQGPTSPPLKAQVDPGPEKSRTTVSKPKANVGRKWTDRCGTPGKTTNHEIIKKPAPKTKEPESLENKSLPDQLKLSFIIYDGGMSCLRIKKPY